MTCCNCENEVKHEITFKKMDIPLCSKCMEEYGYMSLWDLIAYDFKWREKNESK